MLYDQHKSRVYTFLTEFCTIPPRKLFRKPYTILYLQLTQFSSRYENRDYDLNDPFFPN